jgi:thiamine pyrophosphokinase
MDPGDHRDAIVVSGAAKAATLARARQHHPAAMLVAADGGLAAAIAIGAYVDVVVGDFDSADAAQVAAARARGAAIESYPTAKAATDLDLAVHTAIARGATRLIVVDSRAGRLDHFLGATSLLASPTLAAVDVRAYVDEALVLVVRGGAAECMLGVPVGATLTLLPVGGAAVGITTKGLQYPLTDETLEVGTTRGVSNVVEQTDASVALREGTLLVIVPDALDLDDGGAR